MDALAGYGSDDSSVSSVDETTGNSERPTMTVEIGSNKKLLPAAKKPKMEARLQGDDIGTIHDINSSKRCGLLPPPALSKGDNGSWICWKINYLQRTNKKVDNNNTDRLVTLDKDAPTLQKIQENLQRLAQPDIDNDKMIQNTKNNWADHLRSQHEFDNPHFFGSVVEHFGIQEPLDSSIVLSLDGATTSATDIRDYERKLFPVVVAATTECGDGDAAPP